MPGFKIPTQAQLRELASTLNHTDLLGLGLISNDHEGPSGAEIFAKLSQVAEPKQKEKIWSLATDIQRRDLEGDNNKFTLFSQLPFDLRDVIWKLAVRTNNLVELTWQNTNKRWWSTPFCRVPPPAVFSTCRESRESTRLLREKEFLKAFGTVFNVYNDLLFLHTWDEELNRRFMNFCMNLYETRGSDEMMRTLPRLAVTWHTWKDMLDGWSNDDLSVGGESGFLRENLKGLRELILVHVVPVEDGNGRLYEDERVLAEEELLDPAPGDFFTDDREAELKRVWENLKCEPQELKIAFKTLRRGDDGDGGALAEWFDNLEGRARQ